MIPPEKMLVSYSHLSDVELLGNLISPREVRKHYRGSLATVFTSSQSSDNLPVRCVVARELVKRWLSEELHRDCVLSSPEVVRDYLRLQFAGQEHETFVVMFLDAQLRLLSAHELFRGTLTQTSVYPREVVKAALKENAACVILAHNHPSGIADPSQADRNLTQALTSSLALVDVKVMDHFVVAGSKVVSFAELGLL